jgi:hypothetical protein
MIDHQSAIQEAPARRQVATFETYQEAQRAVDFLSDRAFPVARTAIVGEGLRLVEQVTGRTDVGRAAMGGAFSGAVTGLIFGYVIGLLSFAAPFISAFTLALYGFIAGAAIGAILGALFQSMSGGRRDFNSLTSVQAERYVLNVEDDVAPEAARLLAELR